MGICRSFLPVRTALTAVDLVHIVPGSAPTRPSGHHEVLRRATAVMNGKPMNGRPQLGPVPGSLATMSPVPSRFLSRW